MVRSLGLPHYFGIGNQRLIMVSIDYLQANIEMKTYPRILHAEF